MNSSSIDHPGIHPTATISGDVCLEEGATIGPYCVVEHVTLANAVQLGGHVTVGDRAVIGGGTVIHQFVRIGRLAMIAGGEALAKDVLPFGAVFHGRHKGYNAVGCRRAGMDAGTIHSLRAAFREIHSHHSPMQVAREMRAAGMSDPIPNVRELIEFIEASRRGIQPSARSEPLTSAE